MLYTSPFITVLKLGFLSKYIQTKFEWKQTKRTTASTITTATPTNTKLVVLGEKAALNSLPLKKKQLQ